MLDEAPVQADARAVIDWYRARLTAALHDLAFAQCALVAEQEQGRELRENLAQLRIELNALLAQAEDAAAQPPSPEDGAFGAWVAQHWEQIQDARLAHAVEHAHLPAPVEQP